MEEITQKYFNKRQLSAYTGFSVSYISWLIYKRRIPHFKMDSSKKGKIFFKKEDIDKWLEEKRRA